MNFFADQAKAKSNTTKLILLFSLAILSLIAITLIFFIAVMSFYDTKSFHEEALNTKLVGNVTALILGVILVAWFYKSIQLASGGIAVAEMMNGTRLNNNSQDPDERKILNVVEEMSIASGIRVPPVYVIEELGINAFAAGYTTKDTVIVISRGCAKVLNRDELQGVIAHEFSHIFNGDMRMNIRLICVLHGILFLGLVGRCLIGLDNKNRPLRDENLIFSNDDKHDGPAGIIYLMMVGAGLYVIGYLGYFFGGLIKAAVSRQREFLADASAVQFTRNPEGIANALKKIGGYPLGSYIQTPEAHEFSHLFFNQAINIRFAGWMATHPPLKERIKRIDPHWSGAYIKTALPYSNPFESKPTQQYAGLHSSIAAIIPASTLSDRLSSPPKISTPSNSALDSIGQPTPAHIVEAKNTLSSIPETLINAAHDNYNAIALIYCLLLDNRRADILEQQLQSLKEKTEPEVYKDVIALKESVATLSVKFRLPLIDICMPTLKQLSPAQYQAFKKNMLMLIQADNKVDLFEWSLYRIVVGHLENTPARSPGKYNTFDALQSDCQRLISAVALKNAKVSSEAPTLFTQGWKETGLPATALVNNALTDINALNTALKRANTLHPLKKPQLIKACCAALKDHTQPESIELIRAIADGLDVPMPPLLAGQTLC